MELKPIVRAQQSLTLHDNDVTLSFHIEGEVFEDKGRLNINQNLSPETINTMADAYVSIKSRINQRVDERERQESANRKPLA